VQEFRPALRPHVCSMHVFSKAANAVQGKTKATSIFFILLGLFSLLLPASSARIPHKSLQRLNQDHHIMLPKSKARGRPRGSGRTRGRTTSSVIQGSPSPAHARSPSPATGDSASHPSSDQQQGNRPLDRIRNEPNPPLPAGEQQQQSQLYGILWYLQIIILLVIMLCVYLKGV